jgi:hypothetical protein
MTVKLCHPMRICVQNRIHWAFDNWYGMPFSKHNYFIEYRGMDIRIRYENDYWNEEVIVKYGSTDFS